LGPNSLLYLLPLRFINRPSPLPSPARALPLRPTRPRKPATAAQSTAPLAHLEHQRAAQLPLHCRSRALHAQGRASARSPRVPHVRCTRDVKMEGSSTSGLAYRPPGGANPSLLEGIIVGGMDTSDEIPESLTHRRRRSRRRQGIRQNRCREDNHLFFALENCSKGKERSREIYIFLAHSKSPSPLKRPNINSPKGPAHHNS
jgi:hypothetical protein